jgi:hypothetical protein
MRSASNADPQSRAAGRVGGRVASKYCDRSRDARGCIVAVVVVDDRLGGE